MSDLFTATTAAEVEEALTKGMKVEDVKVLVETEEDILYIDEEDEEDEEDEDEDDDDDEERDDIERDTPLLSACRRGALQVVDCLINHGADVNRVTPSSLFAPIQLAAWKGHAAIVERLFRAGADINCNEGGQAEGKYIPLILASQEGHVDVVDCLLSLGADLEKKDEDGGTL